MRIGTTSFFSGIHSWGITMQGLTKAMVQMGNELEVFSTNGLKYIPEFFNPYLQKEMNTDASKYKYDVKLAYTAPHNFKEFCSNGKNRFGIWCTEVDQISSSMIKNHIYLDYLFAPSEWSKNTFVNSGWPEDKCVVVSHGYDPDKLENLEAKKIKTNKKIKILICAGQPHIRKNLPFIFETLFKTFTKKDDVCIVLKLVFKKPSAPFEVDLLPILNKLKAKYPQHPEIIQFQEYMDDIYPLFKACDILYNASLGEAFNYPALDALIMDKIVIAPNYGGHLDFLNTQNSLLLDGCKIPATIQSQYWDPLTTASHFQVNQDDAIDKLRFAVNHLEKLKLQVTTNNQQAKQQLTWRKQAEKMLSYVKSSV